MSRRLPWLPWCLAVLFGFPGSYSVVTRTCAVAGPSA
jgi:hypothetical protein